MKTLLLTAAVLMAFAGTALAAPAPKAPAKTTALICPVTGDKIASPAAAFNHETYKGKTYYFCCASCKPIFDKNPAKVVASAAHGKYSPQ